ncbi:hypothetical protein GCM10009744_59280 [Kribbella alba]|uniref:Uncharacterized protein n=1 Tax=Kribbella alba TaxID=190197 RepID=A0ABN2FSD5_9ACTN
MDNSSSKYLAILDARGRVCEHCASTFIAGRSDQRFCTDLCRLRHWRCRKTTPSACDAGGQQRLDAMRAEVDRLEAQITDLRQTHAALREALATCQCAQSSVDEPTRPT